jgi:hypothetical protein
MIYVAPKSRRIKKDFPPFFIGDVVGSEIRDG